MTRRIWPALAILCLGAACSREAPPAKTAPKVAAPVRITQFYTSTPQTAKGESGLVCYGVENAAKVWISPPKKELSPSPTRCVEIEPAASTTYTLTAEDADGKSVSQTLEVTVGAAKAKIIEVRVSTLQVKRGGPVSICYKVRGATSVQIQPIGFRTQKDEGCTIHQPQQTTTYVVTANGAGGSDQERVTVKVN